MVVHRKKSSKTTVFVIIEGLDARFGRAATLLSGGRRRSTTPLWPPCRTPSFAAVAQFEAEIEARVGRIVRQQERERLRKRLTELLDEARELAEGISRSTAFEPAGANKNMADHKGEAASRVRLAVGSALAYLDLATKWGSDHDPGIV
ncbi:MULTISPECIES: hypothetical protein [Rhizobium]|uniref:hypothetical protein n=1 Tax=Rhizobium TaxID=379 RepID=UPI001031FAC5|nr:MULTISPECIES: hypothetical protein [Rhizobium]TAX51888.1 hypothetical protein ELH99_17765 [Rhizobium leguminosarum]TBB50228.1 hypothetical protein ELH46_16295 [Rhizobium ruizarguesonis]TCB17926.1 hypothetical protein E0J18_12705 [Rhizobium leguminosarum bv. viciae]